MRRNTLRSLCRIGPFYVGDSQISVIHRVLWIRLYSSFKVLNGFVHFSGFRLFDAFALLIRRTCRGCSRVTICRNWSSQPHTHREEHKNRRHRHLSQRRPAEHRFVKICPLRPLNPRSIKKFLNRVPLKTCPNNVTSIPTTYSAKTADSD